MSKEAHLARMIQTGKGGNDRQLAQILVEEIPARVRELEVFGLAGKWRVGRFYCLGKPSAWGAPLTMALGDACRNQGGSILPWIMVSLLLLEEGGIVGALGFNFRRGRTVAFQTKAIMLANGGGAALYQRHENPVRNTGDGYALAFHAGCQLRDMEFVQFMPSCLAEPGKPTLFLPSALSDCGRIINSAGEDILKKFQLIKPVAVQSRDAFSQAIFQEEMEGKQVFLDLRSLSDDEWPEDDAALSQRSFLGKSLSCYQKPLRISPMGHHFMGGVVIDRGASTEIPGLFAAGEVVGCVQGANRMGGNVLAEVLVFGYRAGISAARWAKQQGPGRSLGNQFREAFSEIQSKTKVSGKGLPPQALKKTIRQILWERAGIMREDRGLATALEALRQIREEKLPEVRAEGAKELLEKMEVENALWVGEMITRTALIRKESRGAHFRKDILKMDDSKWKGNIFLKKSNQGMELEFRRLLE